MSVEVGGIARVGPRDVESICDSDSSSSQRLSVPRGQSSGAALRWSRDVSLTSL